MDQFIQELPALTLTLGAAALFGGFVIHGVQAIVESRKQSRVDRLVARVCCFEKQAPPIFKGWQEETETEYSRR